MKKPEYTSTRIIMLGTPGCGDCINAKMSFVLNHIPFLSVNLEHEENWDLANFLTVVSRGTNTVPLIFFFAQPVTEAEFRAGIALSSDASPKVKQSNYAFEPNVDQLKALLEEFGFLPSKQSV